MQYSTTTRSRRRNQFTRQLAKWILMKLSGFLMRPKNSMRRPAWVLVQTGFRPSEDTYICKPVNSNWRLRTSPLQLIRLLIIHPLIKIVVWRTNVLAISRMQNLTSLLPSRWIPATTPGNKSAETFTTIQGGLNQRLLISLVRSNLLQMSPAFCSNGPTPSTISAIQTPRLGMRISYSKWLPRIPEATSPEVSLN